MDLGAELHALRGHLLDAAVEQPFFHFEIGDAVAQQSADAVGFFENRYRMSGAVQLLGGGETRRARSDHGHALAAAH